MRSFEQLVEQAELVQHFERRRVDRVTAKVAQKIGVLLEHDDVHAGAGEEQSEHHTGGPAAHDAAVGRQFSQGWHEPSMAQGLCRSDAVSALCGAAFACAANGSWSTPWYLASHFRSTR